MVCRTDRGSSQENLALCLSLVGCRHWLLPLCFCLPLLRPPAWKYRPGLRPFKRSCRFLAECALHVFGLWGPQRLPDGQKPFLQTKPVSTWVVIARTQLFPSVMSEVHYRRQLLFAAELSTRCESRRTCCTRNSRGSWLFRLAEWLLKVWCYQAWRFGGTTSASFYFLIKRRPPCVVMLGICGNGWSFVLPSHPKGTQDFVSCAIFRRLADGRSH